MRPAAAVALTAAGIYSAWYAVKHQALQLRHFSATEFGAWWPFVSSDLLRKLDEFRERLGHPVIISPAPGAVGRIIERGSEDAPGAGWASQHNVARWGSVRAVDVMPVKVERGLRRGLTRDEMKAAAAVARAVGFTGIGIYPQTKPYPMMHLDVRQLPGGGVATWSRVDGRYLAQAEAWHRWA